MTDCKQQLKELIEDTVFPDIEDAIDDVFEEIANSKKPSKEQESLLKDMNEFKEDLEDILKEIKENELEDEECKELFEEFTLMIKEMETE
ncbi:MAG TPA: hypothetical protein EYG73_12545 [Arcobacter sp.]|nr:hypothetical protein [Arcobacter sp.]